MRSNILTKLMFMIFIGVCQCFDQVCNSSHNACSENEVCTIDHADNGVCTCSQGFYMEPDHRLCLPNAALSEPGGSATAAYAAVIIIVMAVMVLCVVTVVALHQRLNILVPLGALCPSCTTLCGALLDKVMRCCDFLPTCHPFGVRTGRARMVDDLADTDDMGDPVV